jgi:uncharacterized membrane protein
MFHNFIHEILSTVELQKISNEIKRHELRTSGELRVSIKYKRKLLEKKLSLRDLAVREFFRLKMNRTKDQSGILFFLLLKEKQFYILPDAGITKIIEQSQWNSIAKKTEEYFRSGSFFEGIIHVIDECGELLYRHFPRKIGDVDEISNQVAIS